MDSGTGTQTESGSLAELIRWRLEFEEAEMARGSGAEFWEGGGYAEKFLQKYV